MNAVTRIEDTPPPPMRGDIGQLVSIIDRAMDSPNFDLDKVQKLLELKERYEAAEAKKAYVADMAEFKANAPKINKDKHVEYVNAKGQVVSYNHASHSEVTEKIAAGMGAHGLAHRWDVMQKEGLIKVRCVITHRLGHSESVELFCEADTSGSKNAIQSIASAVTYLQRYTLLAATGLTSADLPDDDGRGTTPKPERPSLPEDVETALKDAATLGTDALSKCFQGLSETTRARIVADYNTEWKELKATAAKVKRS